MARPQPTVEVYEGPTETVNIEIVRSPSKPKPIRDVQDKMADVVFKQWRHGSGAVGPGYLPREFWRFMDREHPLVTNLPSVSDATMRGYIREWVDTFFAAKDRQSGVRRVDKV